MKRIIVGTAVMVAAAWIGAAVFAADAPKGMDPNKAAMREKMMQSRESRMETMSQNAQKMYEERIAELKHVRALAVEEKATKTTAALDKLIAKEESQLQKRTEQIKEREAKMQERMKQMQQRQAPAPQPPPK